MTLLKWEDKYCVGIKEIDNQHKNLIEIVNKLHEAMKSGHGSEVVADIIGEMIEYTHEHFQTEEGYMAQYKYPKLRQHRESHDEFKITIEKLHKEVQKSSVGLSLKVMRIVSDWLTDHFAGEDQEYVPYFKEQGLK